MSILCEDRRLMAKFSNGYRASFILRDYATVILGDNSTGKTFLYNLLKQEYHSSKCDKKIHFIDSSNARDLQFVEQYSEDLIIIDKIEAINAKLQEDIQYRLHELGVQCIVFCNTRSMLNYADYSYFTLVVDPHNKRITTTPVYPIKEQFPNNMPGYGGFWSHRFFLEGKE